MRCNLGFSKRIEGGGGEEEEEGEAADDRSS